MFEQSRARNSSYSDFLSIKLLSNFDEKDEICQNFIAYFDESYQNCKNLLQGLDNPGQKARFNMQISEFLGKSISRVSDSLSIHNPKSISLLGVSFAYLMAAVEYGVSSENFDLHSSGYVIEYFDEFKAFLAKSKILIKPKHMFSLLKNIAENGKKTSDEQKILIYRIAYILKDWH